MVVGLYQAQKEMEKTGLEVDYSKIRTQERAKRSAYHKFKKVQEELRSGVKLAEQENEGAMSPAALSDRGSPLSPALSLTLASSPESAFSSETPRLPSSASSSSSSARLLTPTSNSSPEFTRVTHYPAATNETRHCRPVYKPQHTAQALMQPPQHQKNKAGTWSQPNTGSKLARSATVIRASVTPDASRPWLTSEELSKGERDELKNSEQTYVC
jgi:hypothetical protein